MTVILEQAADPGAGRPDLSPTEERIVAAALRLIGRRGVKRLGMQEISEVAGVSRGTLYRYFPSKHHVLAAAANYDEQNFTNGLAAALDSVADPAERIRTFVAFAFDYIRTHPARGLFETEPEFQAKLDWADAFVREEVEPLDLLCSITCPNCRSPSSSS